MLRGEVTSLWSAETYTPGGGGSLSDDGNMIQYLAPRSTAFHALVALGSLWNVLPDRVGPMISHRRSGRSSPSTAKRSSPKQAGGQYAGSGTSSGVPTWRFILDTKLRSKRYSGLSSELFCMYSTYVRRGQSTASARNTTSPYASTRLSVDQCLYTGHCLTGSVRMNGRFVHDCWNSSGLRSLSRVI